MYWGSAMISKTVLVYVPGWPLRLDSFLPKADLARLAAREISLGRDALILDFGTPTALERFSEELDAHARRMERASSGGGLEWLRSWNQRGRLAAVRGKWHRDLAAEIAEERPGKVVYLTETREEYREARSVAAQLHEVHPSALQTVCGAHADGHVSHVAGGDGLFEGVEHVAAPGPDAPLPVYDPAVYPALYAGDKLHQFTVSGNARRVAAEMGQCQRLVPSRAFHVEDRGGMAAARDLASEVMGARLEVWYSRRLRPVQGAEGIASLLEASGCRCADFPLLSGSQRLIEDFFGMTHGVSAARASLRACRAAGIFTSLELVYPCPWDDHHTRAETLLFMEQTLPDAVKVRFPELRYGGRWTAAPKDFGFEVTAGSLARWAVAGDAPQFVPGPSPRPYKMRGGAAARDESEQDALLAEAKTRGAAPDMTAQEALLAKVAGWEGREGAWKHAINRALATGDFAGLADHITQFNRHAGRAVRKAPASEWSSVDLAAVAN